MRYLKLFENISYYQISEDDFDNIHFQSTCEPFTESEYKIISDMLNKIFADIEISYVISSIVPKAIIQARIYFDEIFEIWKFSDEWYYVEDSTMRHYYKCDQFSGLIDCIKKIS
jgi:hypothetical protein